MTRVLAVFLLAWEPLRVAVEWQSSYGTLSMRGPAAIAELAIHAAVAAFTAAAAIALFNDNPSSRRLASIAIAASAAVSVQSLYFSYLPHQTMPGERLPYAILAVIHAAAWIIYLRRARSSRYDPRLLSPGEHPRPR